MRTNCTHPIRKTSPFQFGLLVLLLLMSIIMASCSGTPPQEPSVPSPSPTESAPSEPAETAPASPTAATPSSEPERPAMSPTPSPMMAETGLPWTRGINLGNCLEAPTEGAWGLVIDDAWFPLIKEAGFDHIRLPVRWSAHTDSNTPWQIDPVFLDRVTYVADMALASGLGVILNIHHYEEFATEPTLHIDRLQAIWHQVSAHFSAYPEDLAMELFNEPNGAANAVWQSVWPSLYDIVRQENPDRWICLTGANWSGAGSLTTVLIPEHIASDKKIFATFHFYEPYSFTHQEAEWSAGSAAWKGTLWNGTEFQQKAIQREMDMVDYWAERNGDIPVYLGEFGAYSKADMESRIRWTEFVAREAERRGYAWAYWEFASGFGIYDNDAKSFRQPLLEALIPESQ